MKVGELMTHPVHTCSPDDTLHTAARLMWEHDCGSIPVVDRDGRVIAMLTDRDICMAAYTQGRPLSSVQVRSAMSRSLFSCSPDATVGDAESIMRASQVRRLPVIDAENRLVGIISLGDIARTAGVQRARRKKAVNYSEVGETLDAICSGQSTSVSV
jgi:CBS domain-containing protein